MLSMSHSHTAYSLGLNGLHEASQKTQKGGYALKAVETQVIY